MDSVGIEVEERRSAISAWLANFLGDWLVLGVFGQVHAQCSGASRQLCVDLLRAGSRVR